MSEQSANAAANSMGDEAVPPSLEVPTPEDTAKAESAKGTTMLVYILQALGFFTGITFIAAVIVNYVKREDARGTWLESHFQWQIRTFWWSMAWSILGVVLSLVIVGYFILLANFIWTLYRVIRGWLRMNDKKEMYSL